jgi:hypothetical protein
VRFLWTSYLTLLVSGQMVVGQHDTSNPSTSMRFALLRVDCSRRFFFPAEMAARFRLCDLLRRGRWPGIVRVIPGTARIPELDF